MPISFYPESSPALRALFKIEKKSEKVACILTPGFKTEPINPNKLAKQMKKAELSRRQASLLMDYHLNQSRDLLDRLNYLLHLCNTQKSIQAPPR